MESVDSLAKKLRKSFDRERRRRLYLTSISSSNNDKKGSHVIPYDVKKKIDNIDDFTSLEVSQALLKSYYYDDMGRRIILNKPVKKDGKRLAVKNKKSSSDSIHIVDPSAKPENEKSDVLCGSYLPRTGETYYIDENDVHDSEYLIREGDVKGKVCQNCVQSFSSD